MDINDTMFGMLTSLVSDKAKKDILVWNVVRNNLDYDRGLEEAMLNEEVREFLFADTLVDRFDAVLDTLFVAFGTVSKLMATKGVTPNLIEELLPASTFLTMLSILSVDLLAAGIPSGKLGIALNEGLDIVIKANMQKTAAKNAEGKVQKPKNFTPPEAKLDKLIKRLAQDVEKEAEAVKSARV